jgi:hypothetical protein
VGFAAGRNGDISSSHIVASSSPQSLDSPNTAHLWRALRRTARVACIEYNGCLPATAGFGVPYDPVVSWDGTSWFGAGLKAMERIGAAKGMSLVGCARWA